MDWLLPGLMSATDLHPMVVHFPIAFWIAATVVWGVGLVGRNDATWRAGLRLHAVGAATAVLALGMGFWAADRMGHDAPGHELIHVHRDVMIAASALAAAIVATGSWRLKKVQTWRLPLFLASVFLTVLMSAGADRGAQLVYEYGVGVSVQSSPAASPASAHATHQH